LLRHAIIYAYYAMLRCCCFDADMLPADAISYYAPVAIFRRRHAMPLRFIILLIVLLPCRCHYFAYAIRRR